MPSDQELENMSMDFVENIKAQIEKALFDALREYIDGAESDIRRWADDISASLSEVVMPAANGNEEAIRRLNHLKTQALGLLDLHSLKGFHGTEKFIQKVVEIVAIAAVAALRAFLLASTSGV